MDKALRTVARTHRPMVAVAFGAFAAAAAFAPAPAAAQGLFDFLFGRPAYVDQRPIVAYAPDPGYDLRQPPRQHRRAKPKSLDDFVYTGKPEKRPPPPVGKGPLGAFLNDPTLRPGDVVVTAEGVKVFRGGGGSTHRNNEFVGLAQARSLGGSERKLLASIEKANKLAPQIEVATAAPAAVDEPIRQASNDAPRRHRR